RLGWRGCRLLPRLRDAPRPSHAARRHTVRSLAPVGDEQAESPVPQDGAASEPLPRSSGQPGRDARADSRAMIVDPVDPRFAAVVQMHDDCVVKWFPPEIRRDRLAAEVYAYLHVPFATPRLIWATDSAICI